MSEFSWDPGNIQIRTRSLQHNLEPLVVSVTQLIDQVKRIPGTRHGSDVRREIKFKFQCPQDREITRKQRSRRSRRVLAAVQRAVSSLAGAGREVAALSPAHRAQLLDTVHTLTASGQVAAVDIQISRYWRSLRNEIVDKLTSLARC